MVTGKIRFERHPSDTDRSGVSQPGTIVDKFIGDPFLYNFFIQSQASLIGTSCPSRYIVLKDETNHTVDDLQNIANLVSSGFQRATKSVEIDTPTYYANLVATRAKKWDMSDANGSTVFTTNSGAQTPPLNPTLPTSPTLIGSTKTDKAYSKALIKELKGEEKKFPDAIKEGKQATKAEQKATKKENKARKDLTKATRKEFS
ncbi:Piwi domain-domain-containing protein [Phakopsora pachyrhizi]|uniref:Piwi domain-domain-containing protein n=1 Tax=Phakopsora pachyrhizi TaxID=170000 RepID=A0AAV0BSR0_PHAPC|nr:Piwi domain-domain-containing protein [Phakopsora pachyrhizi]